MQDRLQRITEASNIIHACYLCMKEASDSDVNTRMNYFLGYMDYLSELHRLLYN
jgi:hypothetical protein